MTNIDISPEAVEQLAHHDDIGGDALRFAPALRALSAALTQAQANSTKATAWAKEQHGAADRYAAALTEYRVEAASAHKLAVEVADARTDASRLRSGTIPRAHKPQFQTNIYRAVGTPDKASAHDRMIADAEARGMRRAADIAKSIAGDACDTPDEILGAAMVEYAILAAIPKGGDA